MGRAGGSKPCRSLHEVIHMDSLWHPLPISIETSSLHRFGGPLAFFAGDVDDEFRSECQEEGEEDSEGEEEYEVDEEEEDEPE